MIVFASTPRRRQDRGLSWREMKAGRVAQRIAGGMYFSGQAALAVSESLLAVDALLRQRHAGKQGQS